MVAVVPKSPPPGPPPAHPPHPPHPTHAEADFETALHLAGYGRLSRLVLVLCSLAFFTTGVQNCVMGYVLPAARCDLRLSTYQVGLINMAFMCGGVASAFFWGVVGDVCGRRRVISATLLADAALTLAQSCGSDYRLLLAARSLNGFLIGGPSTLVFSYLSDMVGVRRRQLYLNVTGLSFVAAWLLVPGVSWLVLPGGAGGAGGADGTGLWPPRGWRLLLALAAAPGAAAGAALLALPDSPRLLADAGRGARALAVLAQIHRANHQPNHYPVRTLSDAAAAAKGGAGARGRVAGVLRDLRRLVSRQLAAKSALILFVFFANMAAGFGLNLWIPELLLRMQAPACRHAVAAVAAAAAPPPAPANATIVSGALAESCDGTIDSDIFTSGLIVGACCVAGNALCAWLVAAGGARGVRWAAAACAGACAVAAGALAASACGCRTMPAAPMAVPAAAALTAASLNGNVLLIRLLLHALPPRLSGLGVCWGAWWGRAGGVASNLALGALLDLSCPAPFLAVAALLAVSIVAIMLIKFEKDPEKMIEEEEAKEKIEDKIENNCDLDRYISTHI